MSQGKSSGLLDKAVDESRDHILGSSSADITLVEYGSYACPHCRAANEKIAQVRDQLGDRLRYVFRHYPLVGNPLAQRAAELVERAPDSKSFWDAHITLMTRSEILTEGDLKVVAEQLGIEDFDADSGAVIKARDRVAMDIESAAASNAIVVPTFFINSRRYDGPWDEGSILDVMAGAVGNRIRGMASDFAGWAPSTGVLLLFSTLLALLITNSNLGHAFEALWHLDLGVALGTSEFRMSLLHWVNDGLLTVFFLVVGLEIKREFTIGGLSSFKSGALPVAAALGGMLLPALIYSALIPNGPWAHGWGVPMATDTAFAIAILIMLGDRVPPALRVFLTAAAIVDDIGAIIVVAMFYSNAINPIAVAAAVAVVGVLYLLNYWRIYSLMPYLVVGLILWYLIVISGLHATLTGVLLALFIPARAPPDLRVIMLQADAILTAEAQRSGEVLRAGPSLPAMRALDALHDRLESPADRLLRYAGARSSYVVLPLFALANAGVDFLSAVGAGQQSLMIAIVAGLVIGKPAGIFLASFAAVKIGIARKPDDYSWMQLMAASILAGIGFTMSLFIAGHAFSDPADFAASKIAIFSGSIISAALGLVMLLLVTSRMTPSSHIAVQDAADKHA